MKTLFLFFYLSVNIFALEKLNLDDPSLSKNSKMLLESISKYAIKIGNGKKCQAYVFVDPMCPYSREFIHTITNNKTAQIANTYYIFLYKLPKFESTKLSQYIYQSSNPTEALHSVMVDKKKVDLNNFIPTKEEQQAIEQIANVGAKLHIEIRPYIMEFEEGSTYCIVSVGSAPCTEENDF